MKKIIALLLIIVSVFTLGACGKQKKALNALVAMQENSDPTRVIINTEQTYGAHKLIGEATFVKGTSDGKRAMVYDENYQSMSEIEDQASSPFESTRTVYEYLEGKGVRINNGKWDSTRKDFAYSTNVIDLNLAGDYLKKVKNEDNKLTAVIPSSAVDDVFGEDSNIGSDVAITVMHNGIVITSITISYTKAAPDTVEHDMQVTISASYSYDAETIQITP